MPRNALYEGRWILVALLIAWVVAFLLLPWLALLPALAVLFTFYFFRDPERSVPSDPDAIVAPADGLITAIEGGVDIPGGGTGIRISIFLSVFDVHVNRSPVDGEVQHSVYKPGRFLDARHPDSHSKNESRTWTIREAEGRGTVVVRQITGAIARRIVAWSVVGDHLTKGQRFGMIRFGSRTDLFLPPHVEVLRKKGESVRGAETLLARWKNAP